VGGGRGYTYADAEGDEIGEDLSKLEGCFVLLRHGLLVSSG
jgi:hypothetical protein